LPRNQCPYLRSITPISWNLFPLLGQNHNNLLPCLTWLLSVLLSTTTKLSLASKSHHAFCSVSESHYWIYLQALELLIIAMSPSDCK
jgi:hypothetical protein